MRKALWLFHYVVSIATATLFLIYLFKDSHTCLKLGLLFEIIRISISEIRGALWESIGLREP